MIVQTFQQRFENTGCFKAGKFYDVKKNVTGSISGEPPKQHLRYTIRHDLRAKLVLSSIRTLILGLFVTISLTILVLISLAIWSIMSEHITLGESGAS